MSKIGRNEPCPCGSGEKYKKCCGSPSGTGAKSTVPEFEWENEQFKEVADRISQGIAAGEEYPENFEYTALFLWRKYCDKKNPDIKKPANYAASIEYITLKVLGGMRMTLKGLGEKYGGSSTTISKRYKEIEKVIEEDLIVLMKKEIEKNKEIRRKLKERTGL
ncbi:MULTISPECIES: SEC-C metal-binding domain-containing protein [Pontibacillus]|uniref:SEC-C metal-binding domain-containing protein n=1 Tax=Pontibacillus chungwhensis TaxID=265426 RepID=A0ABY8UWK5_9BACI|nr:MULTISPECIES: SEC-C metal-binding domain-containing protein [Pontibacillus]MCD5324229.1 SEC-C domain-containing protein [Pontibacillus sp. HN14]WIF97715.1 SEC-C metal-binding domain-containing protein [Pontibacillus chungwhensis]